MMTAITSPSLPPGARSLLLAARIRETCARSAYALHDEACVFQGD